MKRPIRALATIAAVVCGSAVLAQMPHPAGASEAQIVISFALPIPYEDRDPAKLAAAQADARKILYDQVARECAAIIDTIANECRLMSMNINVQHQRPMAPSAIANVTYRVVPKQR